MESNSDSVGSTQSTHNSARLGSMRSASWSVGASSRPSTSVWYSHARIIGSSVEAALRTDREPAQAQARAASVGKAADAAGATGNLTGRSRRRYHAAMAVDATEITAEQLREQTLAWLRDNLPPGWMEAVDAGDDEKVSALRGELDYAA